MSDQSLRRADELLTELVEQVETARALPMSSSCVVPREHVLDLLDELREVLPPEIDEARCVIADRDALLHEAYEEAAAVRGTAAAEADAMAANASARAGEIVHAAEVRAYEIVEQGKVEHATLVSATTIHQSAAHAAEQVRAEADAYARDIGTRAEQHHQETVAAADRYAADVRAQAEGYSARLAADSEDYADRTLYELAATLQRAATTAEQGRVALAQRRAAHTPAHLQSGAEVSDTEDITASIDPVSEDGPPPGERPADEEQREPASA
jgi:cell division septum initiation protein DivIVA